MIDYPTPTVETITNKKGNEVTRTTWAHGNYSLTRTCVTTGEHAGRTTWRVFYATHTGIRISNVNDGLVGHTGPPLPLYFVNWPGLGNRRPAVYGRVRQGK